MYSIHILQRRCPEDGLIYSNVNSHNAVWVVTALLSNQRLPISLFSLHTCFQFWMHFLGLIDKWRTIQRYLSWLQFSSETSCFRSISWRSDAVLIARNHSGKNAQGMRSESGEQKLLDKVDCRFDMAIRFFGEAQRFGLDSFSTNRQFQRANKERDMRAANN